MDIILLLYFIGIIWIVIAYLVKSIIVAGFCILISLGMFIWANIEKRNKAAQIDEQRRRTSEEALAQIQHTQQFLSPDYLHALLVCNNTKKFYMATREEDQLEFYIKEYTFDQLFEVAIEEDHALISLYPKNGLLNSTLDDGEKPVVSVAESDDEEDIEEEEEVVEKLCLKIVVDDLAESIVEFVFLENENAVAKDSEEYEEAVKHCLEWYQKISVIIKRLERVPMQQR